MAAAKTAKENDMFNRKIDENGVGDMNDMNSDGTNKQHKSHLLTSIGKRVTAGLGIVAVTAAMALGCAGCDAGDAARMLRDVSEIAMAFGMEVLSYSPHSRMEGVASLSFDDVLSKSDIITLHCPLTDKNEKMISSSSLKHVKRGAILINASRGALIDEDDVIRALDDGTLSYYCADVLSEEPPRNNILSMHPKAIITPHIAWAPLETRRRLLDMVYGNLKSFLEGGRINRVV